MPIIKKCVSCNKEFFVKPSDVDKQTNCSWACRKQNTSKNCLFCGDSFSGKGSTAKYCSKKCFHAQNKAVKPYNFKDITGQRFGKLVALRKTESRNGASYWLFKCDCGKEKTATMASVSDNSHCGCLKGADIANMRSGALVAVKKLEARKGHCYWQCICDCGKECEATASTIIRKRKTSCGCRRYYYGKNLTANGGRLTKDGYVVFWEKNPSLKRRGKYAFEHRIVMEKEIGRPLKKNENIHHKNGQRDDNRPENLELWVKPQQPGQRAEDLVSFAREILKAYGELFPE